MSQSYMHEDELPENMPKDDYKKWYAQSYIPGGVGCRVGPIYPFRAAQQEAAPKGGPLPGVDVCPTCGHEKIVGTGDYSCAVCGFGMDEPCEHWKAMLAQADAQPKPTEVGDTSPTSLRPSIADDQQLWDKLSPIAAQFNAWEISIGTALVKAYKAALAATSASQNAPLRCAGCGCEAPAKTRILARDKWIEPKVDLFSVFNGSVWCGECRRVCPTCGLCHAERDCSPPASQSAPGDTLAQWYAAKVHGFVGCGRIGSKPEVYTKEQPKPTKADSLQESDFDIPRNNKFNDPFNPLGTCCQTRGLHVGGQYGLVPHEKTKHCISWTPIQRKT